MSVYANPGTDGAVVSFKSRYEHYIGGQWVAPVKGQYFENPTPVTGQTFCEVGRGTAEDIEAALDAAHAAAPAWGKTPVAERAGIMQKIADRMEENLELLAVAETWDNGKAVRETLNADIPLAIDHFRYFASAIRAQEGSLSQLDEDTVAYHYHEPLGVVGQIIPWNFPILMAVWKLAPALAAGNAVVLKPAEQTPASILVLAELIGDLLPAGVLNIVNGFGLEAGKPLASNKRIRKIAFTGETTTGRLIMQDHRIREHHSDHARARRQVAQHLLEGAASWRRTTPTGTRRRRAHDVRPQPGRGLHVPVACADSGVDRRPVPRGGRGSREGDQAGQPARHRHDDGRAGVRRPVRED